MKRAMAAFLILLTLCGCGNDTETKEYRTASETTAYSVYTEYEPTDTLTDGVPIILKTIDIPARFFVDLSFSGKIDSDGKYNGTLSLIVYNFEDTDRENPADTLIIYENETFELDKYNDEPAFMWIRGTTDFFTISSIEPNFGSAVRLFDISILGKISPYTFEGGYEIFGENMEFMQGTYNDEYRFYDRGSRIYTEYRADEESKTVECMGTMTYRSDIDATYLVMRSDCLDKTFSGHMTACMFGDYLTEIFRDSLSVYYRVSPDFARTREELEGIFAAAFIDEYIEHHYSADIFESSDKNLPSIFSEDEEGLVYAEYNLGIPVRYDYDTVRLITDNTDPDTLAAVVFGTSTDFRSMIIYYFDKTQEGYPLKERVITIAGAYFRD
ncbi:MAG: hypothetical protein K2K57_06330 [Oscillospiraceae bacterium]|nr:hypothetical protein [Oscillospiraceae bacterium]